MFGLRLVLAYSAFAALAMAVNLLTQEGVARLWPYPGSLYVAILAGTLTGLYTKYELDRRYIFAAARRSARGEGRRFLLYSLNGVFTTLVFWGMELAFALTFEAYTMRYVGAVLGLAIGYWLKYRLDRRFVFAHDT